MATIVEKNNKFKVVYRYTDHQGKERQKWETFTSKKEAKKRKLEIELMIAQGTLFVSSGLSFEEFILEKYIPTYGKSEWKYSTFDVNKSMFKNHIIPYFGSKSIGDIKPFDTERFITEMLEKKVGGYNQTEENDIPNISVTTVRYIYTILKKAFFKAVEWGLVADNPVKCSAPATADNDGISFWEPEILSAVIDTMTEYPLLRLALHLSFAATMRVGEVVGLTFDDIDFDKGEIVINKTLQRVSKESLSTLPPKDLIHVFPDYTENAKSSIIMKRPKSKKGVRINKIPKVLCNEIYERKLIVSRNKAFHGKSYKLQKNLDLIFCYDDGRPIEPKRISRLFSNWQKNNGAELNFDFEKVTFHSIRHTSTSYKLVLSGGDIKTVQADLGDATSYLVTDLYGRVLESERGKLADKFENSFYDNNRDEEKENSAVDKTNTDFLLYTFKEKIATDPNFLDNFITSLLSTDADKAEKKVEAV